MTNYITRLIAASFLPLIYFHFEEEEAIQTPVAIDLALENWSSAHQQRDL